MSSVAILVYLFAGLVGSSLTTDECLPGDGDLQFIDHEPPGFECEPGDAFCHADIASQVWFVCDARGYCNSTWLKNETYHYPFGQKDHFSMYENKKTCENRIVLWDARPPSEGNYTCILTNGTHNISRSFYLHMVCDKLDDDEDFVPEAHQIEGACVDHEVELGDDALIFCEFCTRSKYNETTLQWMKLVGSDPFEEGMDSRWVPVDHLNIPGTTFTTNRTELVGNCGDWEEGLIVECFNSDPDSVRSYLNIQGVTSEALGLYKLVATLESTGNVSETRPVELSKIAITTLDKTAAVLGALAGILVFALVAALLWYKFNLDVKLLVRDRFSKVEDRGNRDYDAYIVYDSSSEEITRFVTEVIRQKLTEINYQVFVKDIDMIPGGFRAEDIIDAINNSLRCILVVSQSFLSEQGQHLELQINAAISDMAEKKTKIIPVLFGDVKVMALGRLLVVLRCLRYKEQKTNQSKFLKKLLLRMPVKLKASPDDDSLVENMEL